MGKKDKVEQFFDALFAEVDSFASGKLFEIETPEVKPTTETDVTESEPTNERNRRRPDGTFTTITAPKARAASGSNKSSKSGNDTGRMEEPAETTKESDDEPDDEKPVK